MARLGNNPTSVLDTAETLSQAIKLYFPQDLGTNRISRFMSFTVDDVVNLQSDDGQQGGQSTGMVCLPIPSNVTDSYSYQYTDAPFGPAASEAIKLGDASARAYAEALWKAAYQRVAGGAMSVLGTADSSSIQRELFGPVNPHLVNQFVQAGFKNHSFFFTLIAKSQKESETVAAIVEFFRYFSAPDFLNERNMLVPHQFKLAYNDITVSSNSTADNRYLPKFNSACYLTDMQVLYNGSGQPQFFVGGAPVEVQLSLNFRETEITTRQKLRDSGNADRLVAGNVI